MCGGGRRAEHQAEEARRQAAQDAARFQQQLEEQRRIQQETMKTLEPKAPTPPPVSTKAQLGSVGVKAKKSKKASTLGGAKGIAQLKVPLNVGGSGAGGTNLPA